MKAESGTAPEPRTIEDYHRTRISGTGCPEDDEGKHYFAFIDPSQHGRVCIDCGTPEETR